MGFGKIFVAGLCLRTILYGIYVATSAHSLRWVLFDDEGWKLRKRPNSLTLATTIIVFLLTTVDLGISLRMTSIIVRGEDPLFDRLVVAGGALENIISLIGDAILIFRCWMTFSKAPHAIYLPAILWISNIAIFIIYTYLSVMGILDPNKPWVAARPHVLAVFYSANIVINVYATSAIIYRILSVTNRSKCSNVSDSSLWGVSRILAESGLLYTLSSALILTTLLIGNKVFLFPISCAVNSIMTGITLNLILIRTKEHRN